MSWYDETVRRTIRFLRWVRGAVNAGAGRARQAEAEVVAAVAAAPVTRSAIQLRKSEALLAQAIASAVADLRRQSRSALEDALEIEDLAERMMLGVGKGSARDAILEALKHPYAGRTMPEWYDATRIGVMTRALGASRRILLGEPPLSVATRLQGVVSTSIMWGHDTALQTVSMGAWARVRERLWGTIQGIDRVQWRSVLDSRTSDICRGLHGNVYVLTRGPRPPAHPRCRSIVIPLKRGETPPVQENFQDWLARQPEDVIAEVLGPRRAEMNLDAALFFRTDGTMYTIDELKQQYGNLT